MPAKHSTYAAALVAGLMCPGVASSGARDSDVSVPADGRLKVSVDGRPLEIFSGPGMPSVLSLRRSLALSLFGVAAEQRQERAARKFRILSISTNPDARIGPALVKGYTARAAVDFGAGATRTKVKWSRLDAYGHADALGGPYAIPSPIVRYHLRAQSGAERVESLRLLPASAWWVAATELTIGGKSIRVALAPHYPTTIASAAAAALIGAAHGGTLTGAPHRAALSHGVDRPARMMRLKTPPTLGPLVIDHLLARTADYGSMDAVAENIDPSEITDDIVVTARRTATTPAYLVYIGADALNGCASITYDKPRRQIRLACQSRSQGAPQAIPTPERR